MNQFANIAAIVEMIIAERMAIKSIVGDEWSELESKLLAALDRLIAAKNEDEAKLLITEVLFLGFHTPAKSIFRAIMQKFPLDSDVEEVTRLGHHFQEPQGVEESHYSGLSLEQLHAGVNHLVTELRKNSFYDAKDSPRRIINMGFAPLNAPAEPISPNQGLQTSAPYYYWFEIGAEIIGSITSTVSELDLALSQEPIELDIVLFTYPGELTLTAGKEMAKLTVNPSGTVTVSKSVVEPESLKSQELLSRRLFFPVGTSSSPGMQRLRCHIYHQQNLLQSWIVTMFVEGSPELHAERVHRAEIMDYALAKTLQPNQLRQMGSSRLHIMINENQEGTHGIRFWGGDGDDGQPQKGDATLPAGTLQDSVTTIREILRQVTWGDEKPYKKGKDYRYEKYPGQELLKKDLVLLAQAGYRLYVSIMPTIAGGRPQTWALQKLMRKTGQLQIGVKEAVNLVFPGAMIYDYPLDDGLPLADYSVCADFIQAIQSEKALAETSCFQGHCPSYNDKKVVCPSGFWGFRHDLGMPVSVKTAGNAPVQLFSATKPQMLVAVSTAPDLQMRPAHEQQLQQMQVGWQYANSRDGALDLMKAGEQQLIYFYCHGGLANRLPYLSLGEPGKDRFTPATLFTEQIYWTGARPLVFINGCHTTALEPEMALELVSGFVESQAAGVIGTEITIFEPMAVQFAETFLENFLIRQQKVGEAIRHSRLQLLQAGNPLGLVYIPFVMPGLQLVNQSM